MIENKELTEEMKEDRKFVYKFFRDSFTQFNNQKPIPQAELESVLTEAVDQLLARMLMITSSFHHYH